MKNDPEKLVNNSGLPRDRATLNAWCRSYAALDPIVNKTIEFYATYPCKFLQIKQPSGAEVSRFFSSQIDKIGLLDLLPEIFQEYWTVGECFVYCDFNESLKMWNRIFLQNPDYVVVKRSITDGVDGVQISLRPDERLRTLILKENPSSYDAIELAKLDKNIIECVKNGENIPLNNFNVSYLVRRQSPYDIRGTSPLMSVLRNLAILEKIRTLSKEYNYSSTDQIQLEKIVKETLGHPDTLMKGDGAIRKELAKNRILQSMNMITIWLHRKIFAPVAKLNDFYEYKDGSKQLILPKVIFDSKKFSATLDKDCAQISAST